jgi:hypothetical protein
LHLVLNESSECDGGEAIVDNPPGPSLTNKEKCHLTFWSNFRNGFCEDGHAPISSLDINHG